MKRYLVCIFTMLTFSSSCLQAYVFGYTRLYNKTLGRTIDVLFDYHVAEKTLSHDDLRYQPIEYLKLHMYPTDAFVLKMLEDLNGAAEPVTIVWETSPAMNPRYPIFMSYGERLIKDRLTLLSYLHADTWRGEVGSIIRRIITIHDPLAGYSDIQKLRESSGESIINPWSTLFADTLTGIRNYYGPYKANLDTLNYETHYRNNEHFSKLADLEMLSHILSSSHRRIILNAGGAHSKRIVEFLIAHAGYEQVYSKITPGI